MVDLTSCMPRKYDVAFFFQRYTSCGGEPRRSQRTNWSLPLYDSCNVLVLRDLNILLHVGPQTVLD
jgi:hypothetical protein